MIMKDLKPIPEYEDYLVSSNGGVYSLRTKKWLKGSDNGNGYKTVQIHKKGRHKQLYRHRLVAILFVQNPLNLPQVDHIDRNKSNNNAFNLRWVSSKQNMENLANLPRYSKKRVWSKYTDSQKIEVFNLFKNGIIKAEISRLLGIPSTTIASMIKRLT